MSEPAPRRRPRPLGVVILALIALIGVALFASLSLDEGDTDPIEIDDAGDVRKLVGGIPQLEDRLGEDNAPVTVEVFNDLQCTDCADWQIDVIEPLIEEEVRGGDVKLEFRHWSMTERPSGVVRLRRRLGRAPGPAVAVHRALLPQPGRGRAAGRDPGVPGRGRRGRART